MAMYTGRMIKINWNSFIKNRVWFGWLWHPTWRSKNDVIEGEWRRIHTTLRFVPVQLALKWRGGHSTI